MKKLGLLISPIIAISLLASCNTKPSYTVTFNGNGGTLVSGNEIQKVKAPSEIVAPVYEKEDYNFTGWDKDITTITTSDTVYAQWKILLAMTQA